MRRLQLFRSLLLLFAFSGGVRAYNVDDRARTVLTSGLSESSSAEELFGFSMAHHRYSDGSQAYVAIIIKIRSPLATVVVHIKCVCARRVLRDSTSYVLL